MHAIGVSTWSLRQLTLRDGRSLDELLEVYSTFGVKFLEINEDYLRIPQYYSTPGRKRLRERIHSLGMAVSSTWFYTDLAGAARISSVSKVVEDIEGYVAVAEELGASVLVMPPGEGWPGARFEEVHAVFRDVLTLVLPAAESAGVHLGLEIGRASGTFQTAVYAQRIVADIASPYLTITPDFEAWRYATPDLPLNHVEAPGRVTNGPVSIDVFRSCLPNTRLIHAKLLRFNAAGEEPHFPIAELFSAIRASSHPLIISIEYEGWIPDIDPHLDCVAETRRGIELIMRYLNGPIRTRL